MYSTPTHYAYCHNDNALLLLWKTRDKSLSVALSSRVKTYDHIIMIMHKSQLGGPDIIHYEQVYCTSRSSELSRMSISHYPSKQHYSIQPSDSDLTRTNNH